MDKSDIAINESVTNGKEVRSIHSRFQDATQWAKHEPFYRSRFGLALPSQWMSLMSSNEDLFQEAFSLGFGREEQVSPKLDMLLELAGEYDIELVRPYINVGIREIELIRHAIKENIDPSLILSVH